YGHHHAIKRSHRTPAKAARPARPDDRGAGRQHGKGGGTPEYCPTLHFEIDRRTGACSRRTLVRSRPQGVVPTEYGRALIDCGVAVFDDLRQGVKNIEFLADPATGEARVGGNPSLITNFATAVVDRLSERYPRMMFHLDGGLTEISLYR